MTNKTPTALTIMLFVIMAIVITIFYNRSKDAQAELQLAQQNNIALTDSVRKVIHENEKIQYEKAVLVTNVKNLSDSIREELKSIKGTVHSLIKTQGTITNPPQSQTSVIEWNTNLVKIPFNFNSRFRQLTGFTQFYIDTISNQIGIQNPQVSLTQDKYFLDLTLGFKTDKNKNIVAFITSPDTNLAIAHLEGAILTDQQIKALVQRERSKRWGIGPNVGYNVLNSNVYIGIGLQYNAVRF